MVSLMPSTMGRNSGVDLGRVAAHVQLAGRPPRLVQPAGLADQEAPAGG